MKSSQRGYEKAERVLREAQDWAERLRGVENSTDSRAVRSARHLRNFLRETVPIGIYEHRKSVEQSPMFYAVQGVNFDITTPGAFDPPAVVYASLYGAEAGKSVRRRLLHPSDGFLVPVQQHIAGIESYIGPRFRLRYRLSLVELVQVLQHAKKLARLKTRTKVLKALDALVFEIKHP